MSEDNGNFFCIIPDQDLLLTLTKSCEQLNISINIIINHDVVTTSGYHQAETDISVEDTISSCLQLA